MNTYTANEILINASRVSPQKNADVYEFILNNKLQIVECIHIESLSEGIFYPVTHFLNALSGVLFELNHVRVNPRLDNTEIVSLLTGALEKIGVDVYNTPSHQSMAICYRPLGEITQNVRFHFDGMGNCIFLCPQAKLRAISGQKRKRQLL